MRSLVLVGSGKAHFREYALASIAGRGPITLVDFQELPWVQPYIHAFHMIAPPVTMEQMQKMLKELIPQEQAAGIITYDDRYVVAVARLAEEWSLPGASFQAAVACKDKWEMRKQLARVGIGVVKAQLVGTREEAIVAATEIGFPLVIKPRALSASIGVVRIERLEDVSPAYESAARATVPNPVYEVPGVLVEEFIEGKEYSIDSLVSGGQVHPCFVAAKLVGLAPYFEEFGHVVSSDGLDKLPGIKEFLQKVHEALGFQNGATHTEVRVTQQGYKVMEVNARLGGDLIPYLGLLATGIDLSGAAADVALGREIDLKSKKRGVVSVRFMYPERDMILRGVNIPEEVLEHVSVVMARVLVLPGTRLLMPPKGYLSRVVVVIARGEDEEDCQQTINWALDRIEIVGTSVLAEEI